MPQETRNAGNTGQTPDAGLQSDDQKSNPAPPEVTNERHPNQAASYGTAPGTDAGRPASQGAPGQRERAPSDLESPGQVEPTGSAGAAAREVNDPNFNRTKPG